MRNAPDGAEPLLPGAVAATVSGLLLAAAFPSLDWGPLALVALAPLLWAWQRGGAARGALYGFISGVAFFGVLLWWSVYFGAVAIIPFVAVQAAYWAAAGAVVGALARRGSAFAVGRRRGLGRVRGVAVTLAARWLLVGSGRRRAARLPGGPDARELGWCRARHVRRGARQRSAAAPRAPVAAAGGHRPPTARADRFDARRGGHRRRTRGGLRVRADEDRVDQVRDAAGQRPGPTAHPGRDRQQLPDPEASRARPAPCAASTT